VPPKAKKKGRTFAKVLSLLEAIFLPFVKQIRFGAAQVHNFGASIPTFSHLNALPAIISIGNSHASAHHASSLEGTVIALIANMDDVGGVDEGVAYDAFAIALFAEPADGDAGLLSAHD